MMMDVLVWVCRADSGMSDWDKLDTRLKRCGAVI